MTPVHVPVLPGAVREIFQYPGLRVLVDGTVGAGGHAGIFLEHCLAPDGQLIGLDRDGMILSLTRDHLQAYADRVHLIHSPASQVRSVLQRLGISHADGVFLDLGVSSYQLDTPDRGFSIRSPGPLDMRMDVRQSRTAYDVVNHYPVKDLDRIFRDFGDLTHPRRISRALEQSRLRGPIQTTEQLRETLRPVTGGSQRRTDDTTRVFQAIRMEVNEELPELDKALAEGFGVLRPGGILAVIAFHSGEDRRVKRFFRDLATSCLCAIEIPVCRCGGRPLGKVLTGRPLVPDVGEMQANPRSRSAKLRALQKLRESRHED